MIDNQACKQCKHMTVTTPPYKFLSANRESKTSVQESTIKYFFLAQ